MAGVLFKEVTYPLAKLVEDIEVGEIGLPDIQRPFVWPNTKVRDLFDSMYKGFPVGYLLFWANAMPTDDHRTEPRPIGGDERQKLPHLLVVDGQQRLTSLYAVLKGVEVTRADYRKERITIAFRPRDEAFAVADAAIRGDPEFIPDITELWSAPAYKFAREFLQRLRERRPVSDAEEDRIHEALDRLHSLRTYPFTAMEISHTADEEQVAEVFVRINSRGTPLNQADFILTLMSVFWDDGRKGLERFCRDSRHPAARGPSPFNHFIQPDPDQLLRVAVALGFRRARLQHAYSVLRGKDLETGEFSEERRVQQFGTLGAAQGYTLDLDHWHSFFQALRCAGYRRSSMVTSRVGLLYTYALFLIGRRDCGVEPFALRNVVARWFFMTALTGRYTTSPETAMEQDLARLRGVTDPAGFVRALDDIVRDTLTEDYWNITLPNQLATSSARSPSLFAYYAALGLLGAQVLFSKLTVAELLDPATHARKSAVERHHLFPKAYLAKLGVTETRDTNQIANYALLEWPDNVAAAARAPAEYFPEYATRHPPEELRRVRYWHALPEGWETMDYESFLGARRKAIALVIRDGFARLWE